VGAAKITMPGYSAEVVIAPPVKEEVSAIQTISKLSNYCT
jgi:hypothetical protein